MTSFHRDILLKSIWMSSARHDAWISSSCSMVRAGATITMGDGSVFVGRVGEDTELETCGEARVWPRTRHPIKQAHLRPDASAGRHDDTKG